VAGDPAERIDRAAGRIVRHRLPDRPKGLKEIESFIVSPFKGVLCLFLLDMGLVAGRGLRASAHQLRPGLIAFGVLMPVLGSLAGLDRGQPYRAVDRRGGAPDDAQRVGFLYRGACGHARRPARGQSVHLSDHVAGNHLSVQSDGRHSALLSIAQAIGG
jgi:hypothetical protein